MTSSPARAARISSAWWPTTTSTGRARLARAASTATRTKGLPPISASSLFAAPMRVDRPAASTIATIWRLAAIFPFQP
jgi:hypothetical protein